jgi:hypothetical protein
LRQGWHSRTIVSGKTEVVKYYDSPFMFDLLPIFQGHFSGSEEPKEDQILSCVEGMAKMEDCERSCYTKGHGAEYVEELIRDVTEPQNGCCTV